MIKLRMVRVVLLLCLELLMIISTLAVDEQVTITDGVPQRNLDGDITSPDVNYDTQGWRVVGAAPQSDTIYPNIGEEWKEEVQQQPPRRRRPGRKRKRRPYVSPSSDVESNVNQEQEGLGYTVGGGIRVAYEATEVERPRQRRPQRIAEEQHWRGDATDERPQRKRNHRRRQRPYLPNLDAGPQNGGQSFPIKIDTRLRVNGGQEAQITVVDEDFKIPSYIEEVNHGFENEEAVENIPKETIEVTTIYTNEDEQNDNKRNKQDTQKRYGPIVNNKSYRRPYSQARRKEAEMQATQIGSATDLKELLKQSGGLSLSEVLQQKNLSLSDLLTGKQYALSALKTPTSQNGIKPTNQEENLEIEVNEKTEEETIDKIENDRERNTDNQRRRLPPVSKENQHRRRIKTTTEDSVTVVRDNTSPPDNRRRLPPTNKRRQNVQIINRENDVEITTMRNLPIPTFAQKAIIDNLIQERHREAFGEESTEAIQHKNDDTEEVTEDFTTTEIIMTTPFREKTNEEIRNRLSLKPRLRLPVVKSSPKRILNLDNKHKDDSKPTRNRIETLDNLPRNLTIKKVNIPNQAIPINIKDIFGMSDIIPTTGNTGKTKPISKNRENIMTSSMLPITRYKKVEATTPTIIEKPTIPSKINAKDEILELLTDKRGGEKLAKILAARNMTLKELVEHRERGSSQVHLADIFHNASKEPDPAEPFLAKSLIEPISKQIYPLKALLEANMRDTSSDINKETTPSNSDPPPMFIDLNKSSQEEESLGIVTLFDKFSDFVGHQKIFDAKDVKKDSDGSSYFTSVINVKPSDESFRESRSGLGFHNSHKQISEIFSSIPTYIKSDNVVEAKVVPDWNMAYRDPTAYKKNNQIELNKQPMTHVHEDVDGDGLIVLDELQKIEQVDNHIAQASNQKHNNNIVDPINHNKDQELNFYTRLPIGVRSAIIVSSSIVGTSLVVFLTIFITCKWRQRSRNLLKYDEGFTTSRVRSPILEASRKFKKNSSSRSISPILTTGETTYKNQKINTMDSQIQKEAQDYLWDSLRRPFQ